VEIFCAGITRKNCNRSCNRKYEQLQLTKPDLISGYGRFSNYKVMSIYIYIYKYIWNKGSVMSICIKMKEVEQMIYNLLQEYREHLLKTYRPDTARTYYKRLCTLFEGQSLFIKDKLDMPLIIEKLEPVDTK